MFGLGTEPRCIFGQLQLHREYPYVNTDTEPDVKWMVGSKIYQSYYSFKRTVRRRSVSFYDTDHRINQLLHLHDFSSRIKVAVLGIVRHGPNLTKQSPIESLRYFYTHNQHEVLRRLMPETLDQYDYVLRLVARYRSVGEKRFIWVSLVRQSAPNFLSQADRLCMEPEELASVTSLARDGYVNFRRIVAIIMTRSVGYGQDADFYFIYSYTSSCALTACQLFCTAATIMQALEMTPLAHTISLVSESHKYRLVNETTRLLTNARTFLQACEPPISARNTTVGSVPQLALRFTHMVHWFNNAKGFGEGVEPNLVDNPVVLKAVAAAATLALSGAHYETAAGTAHAQLDSAASRVATGTSSAPAEVGEGVAPTAEPATERFVRSPVRNRMSFLEILESSSDDDFAAGPSAFASVSTSRPATSVGPFPSDIVEVSSESEPEYYPRADQWIDTAVTRQRTILLLRPPIVYYRDNGVSPAEKIAGLQLQLTLTQAALHYSALNVYPYERLVSKFPGVQRGMMNFGAQVLREVMAGGRRDGNPMASQVKIICMTNGSRRFADIDINDFVFVVGTATRRAAVERARASSSMTCFVECAQKLVAHVLAFRSEPFVPRFAVKVGGGLNDVAQINV